ncbi:MAG: helix-turn-helix domain-containing protein, partial [Thermocrispum sp.]
VSSTAMGRGFTLAAAKATRGWSDEEWDAAADGLRERGLLDAEGKPTQDGADLRAALEQATDQAAVAPYQHLGDEPSQRLRALGKQLSRAVITAGAFPAGIFTT